MALEGAMSEEEKVDIKDYLNREGDSLVCTQGPPIELS